MISLRLAGVIVLLVLGAGCGQQSSEKAPRVAAGSGHVRHERHD